MSGPEVHPLSPLNTAVAKSEGPPTDHAQAGVTSAAATLIGNLKLLKFDTIGIN